MSGASLGYFPTIRKKSLKTEGCTCTVISYFNRNLCLTNCSQRDFPCLNKPIYISVFDWLYNSTNYDRFIVCIIDPSSRKVLIMDSSSSSRRCLCTPCRVDSGSTFDARSKTGNWRCERSRLWGKKVKVLIGRFRDGFRVEYMTWNSSSSALSTERSDSNKFVPGSEI